MACFTVVVLTFVNIQIQKNRGKTCSSCNVLSLMSWLCCVVFRITLIVMLRVSVLCPCGVLLCVANTVSGQCDVLSTCIVIVTYRVL